ncbi:helix-turn-helix transcriptional regulator [Agriterribacter sp.]|uniref:helix-turn-helix domain-containing protein n=1 Tax=Agriterribacter sp. TaxID=2821509 RepID=UPI002B5DD2EB|nr:helix-turn-helix transcriptional regulator [Agriterribacter sp.]HRP56334.1 helix-turn-helix transcriptional regulator [Agriterribacter sp.]
MKLEKFREVIKHTPQDTREYIELSMDILDRIHELLEKKFEGKQKLLAEKMGKNEAEISRWLSGVQNFTIKTITKLEAAFEEKILSVRSEDIDSTFEQVKCHSKTQHARLVIDNKGICEKYQSFESLHYNIRETKKRNGTLMI